MNFRELVDRERRRGRAAHLPPRTIRWAARRCGVSVAHLYNLMGGRKEAPDWRVASIARGLKLTPLAVQRALNKSRREAELEEVGA